ncbi:MarR family transcriptional regulator [Lachnoanaerobaculum umeaense]|uniref:MarR family transcriptional regulator n=1 Tax=Lachnoanaerobaculum umeaense TaxID=617123 RepID=A0A385Q070_9FIRM|nr:MarR family transcriptional regulator [Lachnoanaerobaculum umeaense]
MNVGLNITEKKVIQFLMESSNLTSAELAEKISVTKRTIEMALKSLQEKNIIERIGSKRDGNWIVIR